MREDSAYKVFKMKAIFIDEFFKMIRCFLENAIVEGKVFQAEAATKQGNGICEKCLGKCEKGRWCVMAGA